MPPSSSFRIKSAEHRIMLFDKPDAKRGELPVEIRWNYWLAYGAFEAAALSVGPGGDIAEVLTGTDVGEMDEAFRCFIGPTGYAAL